MSPFEHIPVDDMSPEEEEKLVADTVMFRRWMLRERAEAARISEHRHDMHDAAIAKINEFGCSVNRGKRLSQNEDAGNWLSWGKAKAHGPWAITVMALLAVIVMQFRASWKASENNTIAQNSVATARIDRHDLEFAVRAALKEIQATGKQLTLDSTETKRDLHEIKEAQ